METNPFTIGIAFSQLHDRQLLKRFISSLGYQVVEMITFDQDRSSVQDVDLFLVGHSLAQKFRAELLDFKKESALEMEVVPILIGLPAQANPNPWLKAGFDDVIRLPFTKEVLATRLEIWLRLMEESHLRFRSLYENATLGLYRTTPDGRILLANPALVKMLGYDSLEDLQQRNLETEGFEPGYDRASFRQRLEREEVIRGLEDVWKRKDGSSVYIRESACVIKDSKGNVLCYEGTVEDITERIQMEEELRESEERFRDLYENAPNVYLSVGVDGKIRRCNRLVEKLLGYTVGELLGRPVLDLYADTPHGKAKAKRVLKRFRAGETVRNEKLQMQKANETPVWISLTVNAIRDTQGRIIESRSMVVDITDQRRIEEALQESEEKYRGLYNSIRDAILVADTHRNIIDCNAAFTSLFGYTLEEIKGKQTAYIYKSKAEFEALGQALKDHYGKNPFLKTVNYKKKTGEVFPGETGVFYLKDDQGTVVGFIGLIRDISQKIKAEIELRNSEQRYRDLFEYSSDAIFMHDLKGNIIDVNQKTLTLFGYRKPEILQLTVMDLHPNSAMEKSRKAFEAVSRDGSVNFEIEFEKKNGVVFPAEVSATVMKLEYEEIVLGIVRDITERKQAEQKVQKALQEKEILLKEIHHRVKNNLQVISSLLNLQAEGFRDRRIRALFNESKDRIRSMALVHENLYQSEDYSRVNFEEYLRKLTGQLFRVYKKEAASVVLNLEVAPVQLTMNLAIPCGIVVNELVTNALKHAFPQNRKGEITVSFRKKNAHDLELVVQDNGIGLNKGTEIVKSTSLGINLVSILVEDQLKGTLKIERKNGTLVRIQFPRST